MLPQIKSKQQLIDVIEEYGFLPFLSNKYIPAYSVDAVIDPILWKGEDNIWNWKNEIVSTGDYLYGKFFNNRAGFITREWIPDFVNYRRDGYDFDSLVDCNLAFTDSIAVYEKIEQFRNVSTKVIRKECNLSRKYNSAQFNAIFDFLMMRGYICVTSIERQKGKDGKEYGWGMSRYSTVDFQFGKDYVRSCYDIDPLQSKEKIIEHILHKYGSCSYQQVEKMIEY